MAKRTKRKYYFDEELMQYIGSRIREVRESKGLTTVDLALICGTDTSQINRMELGKTGYSVPWLSRIAKGLQIDVTELYPKIKPSK